MMRYFAYGSNMCTARLQGRVPSAKPIYKAILKGWKFVCNNESKKDGSAKASIEKGTADDKVWGVIFVLENDDELKLDKHEGFCTTYNKKLVTVEKDVDNKIKAMTYIGKIPKEGIKPYDSYFRYIICGAEEHGLPQGYIDKLKLIETQEDTQSCKEKKKCCR